MRQGDLTVIRPLYRYFDFTGRSGRAEYWQYTFAYGFCIGAIVQFERILGVNYANASFRQMPFFNQIFILANAIPLCAVTIRRLHDRNKSGWLSFIPSALVAVGVLVSLGGLTTKPLTIAVFCAGIITSLYLLAQLLLPGDHYPNDFGLNDYPARQILQLRDEFVPGAGARDSYSAQDPARPQKYDDSLSRIERLADMRDRGLLTVDEFQAEKSIILAGMRP